MNIQGYQKMTLLDYPGRMACTVFTGGCNFRCPFCHNAGLVLEPTVNGNAESEVLAYLEKRKGLLDGVCITGGEPLLQQDVGEFAAKVKAMGYSVKLDTNGSLPEKLKALVSEGNIDYIAMDIKSSPEGYGRATGCEADISAIKESVEFIRSCGICHEFRTTAVKGIHTVEDFRAIGEWLEGESAYFIQSFVDSGNLIKEGWSEFSDAEMKDILAAVNERIPAAKLRGR